MIPIPDLSQVVREAEVAHLPELAAALKRAEVEVMIRLITSFIPSAADMNADEVLSLGEVAQLLRLHPDTVRKMAKKGEIPTVILGKRGVGVRRASLRQWQISRERRTFRAA